MVLLGQLIALGVSEWYWIVLMALSPWPGGAALWALGVGGLCRGNALAKSPSAKHFEVFWRVLGAEQIYAGRLASHPKYPQFVCRPAGSPVDSLLDSMK